MAIDWITVSAQIVNFLVLIWLLKRFLYQPVIDAMDSREQRITQRLREADQREQTAADEAREYLASKEELERRRDEILAEARNDAEQEKRRLLVDARAAVDETRAEWQHQAEQERGEFLSHLRRQSVQTFETIARKALRELAGAALEEQIARKFLDRLGKLDKSVRQQLADAAEPVRVSSAFELDATMKTRMTRAIHELLAEGLEVEYAQSPDLVCGIELLSGGRRLAWHLSGYMDDLTAQVDAAFSAAGAGERED